MKRPSLELLLKYNRPGGRYSTYPSHRFWTNQLSHADLIEQGKDQQYIDLYLHIPFCERLCTFCGCNISITQDPEQASIYVHALLKEWDLYKKKNENLLAQNIYIGGGTPTFLSAFELDRLLTGILSQDPPNAWRVIEVDPRSFSREQAQVLKKFNFTSISMGVQDFNDEITTNVNREQSFTQIAKAMKIAQEFGMKHNGIDLIYGLPMQTVASTTRWEDALQELNPSQIAFYPLARVPWLEKSQRAFGEYDLPESNLKFDIYLRALEIFQRLDYIHLGMGHFAKVDSPLTHALNEGTLTRNVMGFAPKRNSTWLGLGVGSISGGPQGYTQNTKQLHQYYTAIDQGRIPSERTHASDPKEREVGQLFEQLICQHKVDKIVAEKNIAKDQLQTWTEEGLLVSNNTDYCVTEVGTHLLKDICKAFE